MTKAELNDRLCTPGCRCRAVVHPTLNITQMAGEDDCPWHGFGQAGVVHVKVGRRAYDITGAPRETLPRMRNGIDFGIEQWVLLRWKSAGGYRLLMWLPAHRYYNGYARASLQYETPSGVKSLYTPKVILEGERLNRSFFQRNAETISRETNLPVDVINKLAQVYNRVFTYYLMW